MRDVLCRAVGPCCCLLMWALVGCGGDAARQFGNVGFDGSTSATGGAPGGARDGGAEHPAASGGMVGSQGGSASGGASGTGGTTGSGGNGNGNGSGTCDQLAADYQKEMTHARMCTLGLGVTQCQHAVPGALGCGGTCTTYVQEAGNLDELRQKWISNNCDAGTRVCPAIACVNAQPGNCYVSGSVTTPQCQSRPLL